MLRFLRDKVLRVDRKDISGTDLGVPTAEQPGARRLALAWMGLGVGALALAGIFAILLVVARIPGTEALFPTQDFFRVALIVHVDQSVLIWFLAFAGVVWSLCLPGSQGMLRTWGSWIGLLLAAAGCVLVAASPFLGAGTPLLANYVPVLDHSLFLIALGLFAAGIAVQVLSSILSAGPGSRSLDNPVAVGALTAALATLLAGAVLLWSFSTLSTGWTGKAYYEYLFWAPGHVLQFAYTQLMLVGWLLLAAAVARPMRGSNGLHSVLLILGVVPLLAVPLIHLAYAPDAAETRLAYTRLMQWGNGLAAVPMALLLVAGLYLKRGQALTAEQVPIYRALLMSLVLFAAGAAIGASIAGVNTVIPAHYHGSIVGVTLALMGVTYLVLPIFGYEAPSGKMARIQPYFYGFGQLLHIAGLAASGAMGIERKTAGAAQGLDGWVVKSFMGVMGLGGLLAVIGGILFVLVVLRALARGR